MLDGFELLALLGLGLVSGVVGGMVGVGGSIVIIPVLTVVMRYDQHLSQATAMIVNISVAAAALFRHHQAQAVRWDVVLRMVPLGIVFILVGVEVSNLLEGEVLKRIYGAFLLYVIVFNALKLFDDHQLSPDAPEPHVGWRRVGMVGGSMGFVAGLLGIGGGPVANPLLQGVCRLPLRQTIATSSAVMCLTALVGSAHKNLTLADLTPALSIKESLLVAACLAPTAAFGAFVGAGLTHALPVRWVRVAFILLMVWASANMLGVV